MTGTVATSTIKGKTLTDFGHDFVSFRHDGIASALVGGTTYQVVSGYNFARYMTLSIREMPGGDWTTYTYDADNDVTIQAITDLHNVANIGIDSDGYLHVAYDMHNTPLLYRRSDAPLNSWTGGLTSTQSMLGTNEGNVTYPCFFTDPDGVLYFLFRGAASGDGNARMYTYNTVTTSWSAATGTGTAGVLLDGGSTTPTESPYWNFPVFDSDFGAGGYMHLSWCWRETSAPSANHDVAYAKWDGTNWTQVDGTAQTVPITTANDDVLDAVAQSAGLANQSDMAVDSNGQPHIAYIKDDGSGNSQIYHAYHNGTSWTVTQVTSTTNGTSWPGAENYIGPLSRPVIVIDTVTDTAYIVYRDDGGTGGILASVSGAGNFASWTEEQVLADTGLINGVVGGDIAWEPFYDRYQWENNKILHLPYPV